MPPRLPQSLKSPKNRASLVVVVAYSTISADPRVLRESTYLAKSGYDVEAIGLRSNGDDDKRLPHAFDLMEMPLCAERGGIFRYLYQYALFFLLSSAALLSTWRKRRLGLVYVHSLPDFQIFCALPLKFFGVPVVLDLHESLPELFQARFATDKHSVLVKVAIAAQKLSARFADKVVVATDSIREILVNRGISPEHIAVVYNSTDEDERPWAGAGLRSRLGISGERLLVHAGGMNEERDLTTLVEAFSEVSRHASVHLILAGDGDPEYVQSLLGLSARLGVESKVHYVGRLSPEDAHTLMGLSELGVVTLASNPHSRIAWPARISEFVNLGKPLVVPDFPFVESILGDAASYYEPGDARSLAAAILELMASPRKVQEATLRLKPLSVRFAPQTNRRELLETCNRLIQDGSAG